MVGEHIRALRGGRWEHAIDCGDETVIHLADGEAAPARVRRSYRPEFVTGAAAVEVVRHRERTFPADEVVARAYSRIADAGLAAMFRDSEAFAEWCMTGRLPPATPNVAMASPADGAAPARNTAVVAAKVEARAKPARPNGEARRRPSVKAKPSAKPKANAKPKPKPKPNPNPKPKPKPKAKVKAKANAKAKANGSARKKARPKRKARAKARRR
jgi:hypothetical protein